MTEFTDEEREWIREGLRLLPRDDWHSQEVRTPPGEVLESILIKIGAQKPRRSLVSATHDADRIASRQG